jgi:hypothetical protein
MNGTLDGAQQATDQWPLARLKKLQCKEMRPCILCCVCRQCVCGSDGMILPATDDKPSRLVLLTTDPASHMNRLPAHPSHACHVMLCVQV